MMYNIRNGTFRYQIPDFLSHSNSNFYIFAANTRQKYPFQKYNLENFCQCHLVHHSEICRNKSNNGHF